MSIICKGCRKKPEDIMDTKIGAELEEMKPEEFAKLDGTYNEETGLFWGITCYIKEGMPLGKA